MALSDLSSPAAVLSAIEEFDQLGQSRFLDLYKFGSASRYMVLFKGREYDSKAVAGVAHKYQFPEKGVLSSDSFGGGVSTGAAAKKLASIGFEIVTLDRDPSAWTLTECELVAKAYFECLREHLHGRKINKADIYRKLSKQLEKRTPKSVEYKFQNISAILTEEGLPTLGLPMSNYQNLLKSVIRDYLRTHPHVFEVARTAPPEARPTADIFVAPPPKTKGTTKNPVRRLTKARVTDWARQDAENRTLGELGERWVVECEKKKLVDAGRDDLAAKIIWVSKHVGDGYGYDVSSFSADGEQILIEIKTTNGAKTSPFYISRKELETAKIEGKKYRLYRVFDFAQKPYIFELLGPLDKKLLLTTPFYMATVA